MAELTNEQLQRQDFVDNAIFQLIHSLIPTGQNLEWDIAMIAAARDCISSWIVERKGICEEMLFYPYIED